VEGRPQSARAVAEQLRGLERLMPESLAMGAPLDSSSGRPRLHHTAVILLQVGIAGAIAWNSYTFSPSLLEELGSHLHSWIP
jgi:hypothetical protein